MATIPEKLRSIMQATGKTQTQIAEDFSVSQSTVNRWLRGAEPEGHRRDAINLAYRESGCGGLEIEVSDPAMIRVAEGFRDQTDEQKAKAVEMLALLKDATPDQAEMAVRIIKGVLGKS